MFKIFSIGLITMLAICLAIFLFLIKSGGTETIEISVPFVYETEEGSSLSVEALKLKDAEDYQQAIEVYKKILSVEPQNPKVYYDLSDCYFRLNDYWTAIKNLDSAIVIDSTFAGFYVNRGLMYFKLDFPNIAINDLEHATRVDPQSWPSYANLAIIYHKLDRQENACEAMRKAQNFGLDLSTFKTVQTQLLSIQKMCE